MLPVWFKRKFKHYYARAPRARRQSATTLVECLERHEKPERSKLTILFIFSVFFIIICLFHYERNQIYFPNQSIKSSPSKTALEMFLSYEDIVLNQSRKGIKGGNDDDVEAVDIEDPIPEPWYETHKDNLPKCIETFIGSVPVTTTRPESLNLEHIYPMIEMGGYYNPPNCKARHKVAILVPIRDRNENLEMFLYNIHPFLMRQQLEYRIYVIEQTAGEAFNKGRLFNAGFLEIEKTGDWQCVVFHDVDLLPTNDRIRYSCPIMPRHMCASVIGQEHKDSFKPTFGGVTAMTMWQYKVVNGYSNVYWGWGGEDNDMLKRVQAAGIGVTRYKKEIARYTSLPHHRSIANKQRYALLRNAVKRYKTDGLTDIRYNKLSFASHHLYTRYLIDVNPKYEPQYITEADTSTAEKP